MPNHLARYLARAADGLPLHKPAPEARANAYHGEEDVEGEEEGSFESESDLELGSGSDDAHTTHELDAAHNLALFRKSGSG